MRRPPPTVSALPLVALLALAVTAAACGNTKGVGPDDSGDPDGGAPSDPDGGNAALTCNVQAPTACAEPAPHFADIRPIIELRCVSCHYGAYGGPWPLILYGHVADWRETVRDMLVDCSMPPPEAGIPMTNAERMAILNWIRCGALE